MQTKTAITADFEQALQQESINSKGFGIIPKFVMMDTDLSIEAKGIYAYLCSYAGNKSTAYPSTGKIMHDLGICKTAYYRHYKQLVDQGYITRKQRKINNKLWSTNIYTLVSNPKKLQDKVSSDTKPSGTTIMPSATLKAAGFGIIPKSVMLDPNLPLKAKAIYAYFVSVANSDIVRSLSQTTIMYHLQVSENTYRRYMSMLTLCSYIVAERNYQAGRFATNSYTLNNNPENISVYAAEEPAAAAAEPQTPVAKTPYLKIQYPIISPPIKQDTNITSFNITSFNKRSLSIQQAAVNIKEQIEYDYLCRKGYDTGLLDNLVSIIADGYLTDKYIYLGGMKIAADVLHDRLSQLDADCVERVIQGYQGVHAPIRNTYKYLLKSLYSAPATGDLFYANQVNAGRLC